MAYRTNPPLTLKAKKLKKEQISELKHYRPSNYRGGQTGMDLRQKHLRSAGAAQTSHSQCPCRQRPEAQRRRKSASILTKRHFYAWRFRSGLLQNSEPKLNPKILHALSRKSKSKKLCSNCVLVY